MTNGSGKSPSYASVVAGLLCAPAGVTAATADSPASKARERTKTRTVSARILARCRTEVDGAANPLGRGARRDRQGRRDLRTGAPGLPRRDGARHPEDDEPPARLPPGHRSGFAAPLLRRSAVEGPARDDCFPRVSAEPLPLLTVLPYVVPAVAGRGVHRAGSGAARRPAGGAAHR